MEVDGISFVMLKEKLLMKLSVEDQSGSSPEVFGEKKVTFMVASNKNAALESKYEIKYRPGGSFCVAGEIAQ